MFSFFKSAPTAMQVNELNIAVNPNETILSAALRNGVNFPYSCKVGGCAECKCKLTKGKIKAYTDASYLLSAEEIQSGHILACQSVPKTSDVVIEVDLSRATHRQIRGKISAQKALTHDITLVELSLDEAAVFKAGQYAMLSLDCLPDVSRAYSFASKPSSETNQVSFFVRHVPNGVLSTLLNSKNLVSEAVTIDCPMGDFYLRPSDGHMLMIAGGSGLAPLMSVLEKAKEENCIRPITLLLGARTQADIYYINEINDMAKSWPSSFEFLPILSEEPQNSSWQGLRGYIDQYVEQYVIDDSQVYLCGPPVMIDCCVEKLKLKGISENKIFADRFLSNFNIVDTQKGN